MKKVLIATDGSAGSERALAFAAELASSCRADLIILAVCGGLIDQEVQEFAEAEMAAIGDIVEADAEASLSRARLFVKHLNLVNVVTHIAFGDPAAAILRAAKEMEADIIVVGKRGRGRLQGLLLGSVSQKLASLSPRPVTIVP